MCEQQVRRAPWLLPTGPWRWQAVAVEQADVAGEEWSGGAARGPLLGAGRQRPPGSARRQLEPSLDARPLPPPTPTHARDGALAVYKAICKRTREVVVLKSYQMSAICELYQHQIFR
jgi:hypothetical protein